MGRSPPPSSPDHTGRKQPQPSFCNHTLLADVSPAEMEPDMQEERNSLLQHITEWKAFEVSIWDGPKNKCAV